MSAGDPTPDVIVIGAGVVGLSAALMLRGRGLSVAVIDREGPAAGASAGNAGAFAFADILPLAAPRMMRKAPGWFLDPVGPLSIPPAYALRILPWLARFARACAPGRVAASTRAQSALMDLARAELVPFMERSGTAAMLHRRGSLELYESEAEFAAAAPAWRARQAHGFSCTHLDAAGIAALQPGLSPRFIRGTHTDGWWSIADPKLYVLALADRFRAEGGRIETGEVASLAPDGDGVDLVLRGGGRARAGQVVVAAGAFSHRLARTLGERIPLETERGYNTTLPPGAFDLRLHLVFGGHGFVVGPLDTGVRVGGAVELGGLDLPPNWRRAQVMLDKAQTFLPGLRAEGGRQWMGFRPSLPDTLPAIGHARDSRRVIYAFGHGHVGLTQSAGTARLVADLATGAAPAIDLAPFSPQRFGNWP